LTIYKRLGTRSSAASGAINTGSNTVNVTYYRRPFFQEPNRDNISLTGGTGTGVNTITFDSAVVDPVMAIWSLGAGGAPVSFVFLASEPFTIQSGGPSVEFGGSSIAGPVNEPAKP